ncbi:hypothetical protein J5X84_35185 [Streptosporangiaceae bacterium NEAU-GS5]|nr:hypothetical protein [Streptosporangiaceae bacterium NEAU-GS5]
MNGSASGVGDNEGDGRHVRGRGDTTVAWVESPLQMLCVIEAHHAGLLGAHTTVVPRARLAALRITRNELNRLDLPPGLRLAEPSDGTPRPGRTWVVGDAFSGRVQLALLTSVFTGRPRRVVLVDDGLATIRLLELLTNRKPLLRARAERGLLRSFLGAAAGIRLRGVPFTATDRLTVFTALPVPAPLAEAVRRAGPSLVGHDFAWLRSQPAALPPRERTIVLGTSLVRNGLIHRDHYLRWLEGFNEPVAYYPHRREDPRDLSRVRRIAGVTIYDAGVPAEMTLRDLGPDQRVLSLPSTAVTSLRVLLAARGVSVEAVDVPDTWWTASAGPSLRSHLQLFSEVSS